MSIKTNYTYWNHLGAKSNYVFGNSSDNSYYRISEALVHIPSEKRFIDHAGILGVLMKNYPLANRTLVSGVSSSPWMARPDGNGGWECADIPKHGNIQMEPEKIASKLFDLLCQEASSFLQNKRTIGILLSGGMDSRMIAGIVKHLQQTGNYSGQVVALSWGIEGCRDVEYACRIAQRYRWEHEIFKLTPETLHTNIQIAGELGAEFAPMHLHAMPQIRELSGIDGIIAGSFGNSVGRAEYSGKHITQLRPILEKHFNRFAFLKKAVQNDALKILLNDAEEYRKQYQCSSPLGYNEMELQAHYWRKMLSHCMYYIGEKMPLYQMFTHPNIFGFMWSLAPACRNNSVYKSLIQMLPGQLWEIPWARTGRLYEQENGKSDSLNKSNNEYGKWLRNDLRDIITNAINSDYIRGLGIFNDHALDTWGRFWPPKGAIIADKLDDRLAWLASLAVFVKKYDIQLANTTHLTLSDYASAKRAAVYYPICRIARKLLKK